VDCPACGNSLTTTTAGRITVDVCERGCGGIWFDRYELMKVDEADESAGEGLLEVARDLGVHVDLSERLYCPKCPDVVMMRHLSSTCF
jgi:Zn-finger nucleic acid-binding protein